jgi:hypothetical protein
MLFRKLPAKTNGVSYEQKILGLFEHQENLSPALQSAVFKIQAHANALTIPALPPLTI